MYAYSNVSHINVRNNRCHEQTMTKNQGLICYGVGVDVRGTELKLQLIGRCDAAAALLYWNALHAVCRAVDSQSVR